MRALTLDALPRRMFVLGSNQGLSRTAFQDAAGLNACRCPECHGLIRTGLPADPALKPFAAGCKTCGGAGLNRHVEAA